MWLCSQILLPRHGLLLQFCWRFHKMYLFPRLNYKGASVFLYTHFLTVTSAKHYAALHTYRPVYWFSGMRLTHCDDDSENSPWIYLRSYLGCIDCPCHGPYHERFHQSKGFPSHHIHDVLLLWSHGSLHLHLDALYMQHYYFLVFYHEKNPDGSESKDVIKFDPAVATVAPSVSLVSTLILSFSSLNSIEFERLTGRFRWLFLEL